MKPSFFYGVASLAGLASALPAAPVASNQLTTVHQFPNFTWIENIAIRSTGEILGTDAANSRVVLVDPRCPEKTPAIIAQFPNTTHPTGIVEMQKDVFYVQGFGGDLYKFNFTANSSVIYKVDLRSYATTGRAIQSQVLALPDLVSPNGMAVLSKTEETVLIGDSEGGKIWRVNLRTGAHEPVITGPYVEPIPTFKPPFGVNGVQIRGSTLYFVNTSKGLVVKVPISKDGRATGPQTLISDQVPNADDFDIDSQGNLFVCQNQNNTLVRVTPSGQVTPIAGGQTSKDLLGPVAAKFGRGQKDRDVLYISTDGLSFDKSGTRLTTAGKIAAIRP